ncbi:hypothetical protein PhaeoP78_00344 [Phaeobacter inhibens]|nr:hypothetical protein PhaeoP78_00344 [Phaeobacter inhibens]
MPQPHEEERTFAASAAANHHRMEGGADQAAFRCARSLGKTEWLPCAVSDLCKVGVIGHDFWSDRSNLNIRSNPERCSVILKILLE